jgi:ribosomal protein S18 acetylase RimI-like enzyme
MALIIRPAEPEDAEAIARLGDGLNRHEGRPGGLLTAETIRRDGFGPEPAFEVLLAEWEGQAVGYALFHAAYEASYAARGIYLVDLYVDARARRRGIGRRLLARLAAEARARGLSYLWWASRPSNAEANAFYRKLGARQHPVVAHALTTDAFEKLADEGTKG